MALREAGFCREIAGVSNDPAEREKALALQVVDQVFADPAEAVAGAELVVVAVPLGAFGAVFDRIAGAVGEQAVITDVGSAKGSVVEQARLLLGQALPRFVPGHPIAGTERNGVEAAFAGLYRGHRVILTPLPETDPAALTLVRAMWRATGAEPEEMAVDYHDRILAATSHLPHMLAYSLVDCLAQMEEAKDLFRLAAGGFEDFTRIASSSPEMWRDIVFANREALLGALHRYR
ncbi:MAG: prephenate dehydrogenase/arogenate dehydrogenase family protein, partial [Gammaproteobacteria bacterium]